MKRQSFFSLHLIIVGLFGVMLYGCAVGPDYKRPDLELPTTYNQGSDPVILSPVDGTVSKFVKNIEPVAQWWKLFRNDELNRYVDTGVRQNLSLKAAEATLQQSKDLLKAGAGSFYPQIGLGFSSSRQKFSPTIFGSPAQPNIFNLNTASVSVSYALDIFGGTRRNIESLAGQSQAQHALMVGSYLILTSNIVNTLFSISGYREELAELATLIDLQKAQIKIAKVQYKSGLTSYASVLNNEIQLQSYLSLKAPLKQKLDEANHLLAILQGELPANLRSPYIPLKNLKLPDQIPLSVPSKLVERRPDILAAEAELFSATANIGVATAALFPNFSLMGSYGVNAANINNLFTGSNAWNYGLNLLSPIFRGGTLMAQRQAAIDAFEATRNRYKQTVLSAFAQVADTLRALENDAEVAKAQEVALEDAEIQYRLVKTNYEAGLVAYNQLIMTDINRRQVKIALLQAKVQNLQNVTALYIALGGGWWDDPFIAEISADRTYDYE